MKYLLGTACWCFAWLYPAVGVGATEYRLTTVPGRDHALAVSVDRPNPSVATALTLRGVASGAGVKSQIENPVCDGMPLNGQAQRGTWLVPVGCHHISWRIGLDGVSSDDASGQRSIVGASGRFMLISESTSLPRLEQTSSPETLLLSPEMSRETLPHARSDGTIALPDKSHAPLFLLISAKPVAVRSTSAVSVRYFIDVSKNLNRVPTIDSVARGLRWLTGLIRPREPMEFNYVWLGRAASSGSIGGATGEDLVLVNYLMTDTRDPLAVGVIRATPFTEATHVISGLYGPKPAWVEESLAMYMGLETLGRANPNDPTSRLLLQRFQAGASQFPMGLIAVQREVSSGDGAHYAAFLTKGVAFWASVDSEMQALGVGSLLTHLEAIWSAKYDRAGRPSAELWSKLGLPEASWKRLEDAFLGG